MFSDQHEMERWELEEKVFKLMKTLEPMARVADGIPDNWPDKCVLTLDIAIDQNKGRFGQEYSYLNYLGANVDSNGITIAEYREAEKLLKKLKSMKFTYPPLMKAMATA